MAEDDTPGYAAIRRRPGMYLGGTEGAQLQFLVGCIFEPAADAARAGRCRELRVELLGAESIAATWDAAIEPRLASVVEMPGMHCNEPIALAHALAATFRCEIVRGGRRTVVELARGEIATPLAEVGASAGPDETRIVMRPDPLIFGDIALSGIAIAARLEAIAHLCGLTVMLVDRRDPFAIHERTFAGDIAAWVARLAAVRAPLHATPIRISLPEHGADLALAFCGEPGACVRAFANGRAVDRGTHVEALRTALAELDGGRGTHASQTALCEGYVAVLAVETADMRLRGIDGALATRLPGLAGAIAEALAAWRAAHPEISLRPDDDDVRTLPRARALRGSAGAGERRSGPRVVPVGTDPQARTLGRGPADAADRRSGIAALERTVRGAPDDIALSLVYADALQAAGDPRGELLAIEHALRAATDPGVRDDLDRRAAEILDRDRDHIWGRPGGFPFRDRWTGRATLRANPDDDDIELPDGVAAPRVHRMLATLTDSDGPHSILTRVTTPIARGILSLGYAAVTGARDGEQQWRRDPVRARLPADRAHVEFLLVLLAQAPTEARLEYAFSFTAGGRLLPYQRAGWFADGLPMANSLELIVGTSSRGWVEPTDLVRLDLRFPFERADDPAFVALRAAIEALLGGTLRIEAFPPPA